MRIINLVLFLVCGLALSPIQMAIPAEDAKTDFLGGKDLEGWQGLMKHWSIKDGAIIGSTLPDGIKFNTFLCSKKKYKDFELQFQVKLHGQGLVRQQRRADPQQDHRPARNTSPCRVRSATWATSTGAASTASTSAA